MDLPNAGPPDTLLRQIAFGAGCLFALFGLAIASLCLYSAFFPGGSGEWEGMGQVAALVLQVPAGLAALGLAFSQLKGRRRSLLLWTAAIILLMPIVTLGARKARSAWYQRQLERSMHVR